MQLKCSGMDIRTYLTTKTLTIPWKECNFKGVSNKNWVVKLQTFLFFTPEIGEDEPILTRVCCKWVGSTTTYKIRGSVWIVGLKEGMGVMVSNVEGMTTLRETENQKQQAHPKKETRVSSYQNPPWLIIRKQVKKGIIS